MHDAHTRLLGQKVQCFVLTFTSTVIVFFPAIPVTLS